MYSKSKRIDYLIDSFQISKVVQCAIKGKRYSGALAKYYFEDIGLRNTQLGSQQIEQMHLNDCGIGLAWN